MTDADRRSEARERALYVLYESASKDLTVTEVFEQHVLEPDPLTKELALGTDDHRSRIDALIAGRSEGWTLERMAVIDLAIMRLAVFELLERPEVPAAVVLDEAVELATRFSTDASGRFVNGVLAAIARDLGRLGD